jgi:hypothetical protein
MRGKTVVITGGTSGIGEVAAVTLARMGARIVLISRDNTRADATLARLRENAPGIAHAVYFADLLREALPRFNPFYFCPNVHWRSRGCHSRQIQEFSTWHWLVSVYEI